MNEKLIYGIVGSVSTALLCCVCIGIKKICCDYNKSQIVLEKHLNFNNEDTHLDLEDNNESGPGSDVRSANGAKLQASRDAQSTSDQEDSESSLTAKIVDYIEDTKTIIDKAAMGVTTIVEDIELVAHEVEKVVENMPSNYFKTPDKLRINFVNELVEQFIKNNPKLSKEDVYQLYNNFRLPTDIQKIKQDLNKI